jgi:hypothetical protein
MNPVSVVLLTEPTVSSEDEQEKDGESGRLAGRP